MSNSGYISVVTSMLVLDDCSTLTIVFDVLAHSISYGSFGLSWFVRFIICFCSVKVVVFVYYLNTNLDCWSY